MAPCLRFLRPYSLHPLARRPSQCSAYLRFYELLRTSGRAGCRREKSSLSNAADAGEYKPEERSALVAARLKELGPAGGLEYPRFDYQGRSLRIALFRDLFSKAKAKEMEEEEGLFTLSGRVLNIRRFGAKFFFMKIVEDDTSIQVMVNFGKLKDEPAAEEFKKMAMLIKRGDQISVTGRPALTDSQELAIQALQLPRLFSPSIAPLPFRIPEEARMQQRHLDLLINRSAKDILVLRAFILKQLRSHLHNVLKCTEVQTPILAANAGGAVARPFSTHATEFPQKELALRIAPELWLKRLVVSGFDRVFEIGPAFRNEGIDATHNPEFTVCEFYLAHTNLEALMNITQDLFHGIAMAVYGFTRMAKMRLDKPDSAVFSKKFTRLEFLPEIEKALGHHLPDLDSPQAVPDIIKLINDAGKDWLVSLPSEPSLPKLLDHMAAAVLEPQSEGRPLFITNHPVCMSPLAKSFTCPTTGQQVAARAELFFDGNELANMYEEENDPFKQRRKFESQAKARLEQQGQALGDDDDPPHVVDEQYISVLESGLPPTGGWGCGVDRMVMLFSGAKRISDVLPFGNLRNVVGLASTGPQHQRSNEDDRVEEASAKTRETRETARAEKVDTEDSAASDERIPSGFDAFSAASFLDVLKENVADSNADHDVISGSHVNKHASKITDDDIPLPKAGNAAKDQSLPDSETDNTVTDGSRVRRHVSMVIEDNSHLPENDDGATGQSSPDTETKEISDK